MKQRSKNAKSSLIDAETESLRALDTYQAILSHLTKSGLSISEQSNSRPKLPYVQNAEGLENLYLSLSSVAPARPAAVDEEWNPLSQRPHSPLPTAVGKELGAEITALKEAIDSFTTLSHEMMHVALWEPFFTGSWRPRSRKQFRDFSLMAEGYCFFFSDIIVSALVRVRFADGEFALARQTPSNALFHPIRAFDALGFTDRKQILDIYLEGFVGKKTSLAASAHSSSLVSSLAGRIQEFYKGTVGYLNEMHAALMEIGVLDEFYQRFCNITGLPTFLKNDRATLGRDSDFKPFFHSFFSHGQKHLGQLPDEQITSIRWRRMLQSRAYYALQVRWFLTEGRFTAKSWRITLSKKMLEQVNTYLDSIENMLINLSIHPKKSPLPQLGPLDKIYDEQVRRLLIDHEVWAGHRWLIVPKRAGGYISIFEDSEIDVKSVKIKILKTVTFIIDELTREMKASQTIGERTDILKEIERVASIGSACKSDNLKALNALQRKLNLVLVRPIVRRAWSLPLAAFNPKENLYRELAFSYQ
jgi:hypothetical protein